MHKLYNFMIRKIVIKPIATDDDELVLAPIDIMDSDLRLARDNIISISLGFERVGEMAHNFELEVTETPRSS